MQSIVPSILEKNFSEIKNKLNALRERTKTVQIDFCDGVFVPNQTWPFATGGIEDYEFQRIMNEEEGMPFWQEFDFEFDMMVHDAVENFDIYMKLGPKRMIFHLSAQKDLEVFTHFLESLDMYTRDNVEMGLAFKPSDDMEAVIALSHKVDFLQCMGSDNMGVQGQEFSPKALDNIKYLKEKLPGVIMSVDIGINLDNIEEMIDAGADRFAIGSAIWKSPNPLDTLENFQSLV